MKTSFVTLSVLVACAGCSPAPETIDATDSGGAEPSKSTRIDFTHPTTADELKETFTAAFNAGDTVAIEKMIYWGASTPKDKSITQSYIVTSAGKKRVLSLQTRDVGEKYYIETRERFTIEGPQMLEIEHGDDSGSETFSWPFGEIEGKFYLGAWCPKPA